MSSGSRERGRQTDRETSHVTDRTPQPSRTRSSGQGSSANRERVDDFATLEGQLRESAERAREQSRDSDTTSSSPEIVPVASPENPKELVAAFRERDKSNEDLHKQHPEQHRDHLKNSEEQILLTAKASLEIVLPPGYPKNALLIDPANCHGIPLEKFAEMFDCIEVMAYDVKSTKNIIKRLRPDLRPKFKLIPVDPTGIANEFYEKLSEAVDKSETGTKFIRLAREIARKMNEEAPGDRSPRVRGNNTFICSHLAMCRLFATPLQPIEDAVKQKFGIPDPFLVQADRKVFRVEQQRLTKEQAER